MVIFCCGFRLRQMDVQFMKHLHDKVNIVPVIAKADTLTPTELRKLKDRVSYNVECTLVLQIVVLYQRNRQ